MQGYDTMKGYSNWTDTSSDSPVKSQRQIDRCETYVHLVRFGLKGPNAPVSSHDSVPSDILVSGSTPGDTLGHGKYVCSAPYARYN